MTTFDQDMQAIRWLLASLLAVTTCFGALTVILLATSLATNLFKSNK